MGVCVHVYGYGCVCPHELTFCMQVMEVRNQQKIIIDSNPAEGDKKKEIDKANHESLNSSAVLVYLAVAREREQLAVQLP